MLNFLLKPIYHLEPPALGIDISDLSFKVVQIVKQQSHYKLVHYGEYPIPSGVIERGILKQEEALAHTLAAGLESIMGKNFKKYYAVASLPEQETFLRIVPLSHERAENLEESVRQEIEANIPIAPEDLYVDSELLPKTAEEETIALLLVATSKEIADPYIRAIKAAGVHLKALELESQALARSVVPFDFTKPVMVVDFGATSTGISIQVGGIIEFTSTIPFGGRDLETALKEKLGVSSEDARALKINVGMDRTAEQGRVYEALKPSIDGLIQQIQDYISYHYDHRVHGASETLKAIFLSGGDGNLIGLTSYMSLKLKVPTELANPFTNIMNPKKREIPAIPYKAALKYAVALGLALRGSEELEL